jgi:DinB superfamily
MKIPEMNHHEKSRQKAAPVQRCAKIASFRMKSVGKLYMPYVLADSLRQAITRALPELQARSEEEVGYSRTGWSPKEELGHLIDSATNNHILFVRTSLDGEFEGRPYAQDDWVTAHAYRDFAWPDLVDLWYRYNLLLAHMIERIPDEHMKNRCVVGGVGMTLHFVVADYIRHMRHHLDHLLSRDGVTDRAVTEVAEKTDQTAFVSG